MIRKAVITIPTPCHENWERMSDIQKGKFCGSCQKNVYDFTKSSDPEILEKINKEKNICGRFLNSQLDRDITIPKEKSSFWMAAASAVVTLVGLGSDSMQAQVKKGEIVQTEDRSQYVSKPTTIQPKTISGVVWDEAGPISGAKVSVIGTDVSAKTDVDGKFSISAGKGQLLRASFAGMKDVEIKITRKSYYKILLDNPAIFTGRVGMVSILQ